MNINSNFTITHQNKNYNYDLGPSKLAQEACYRLELYKKTKKYEDLRRVFSNLYHIVLEGNLYNNKEGNLYSNKACLATQAFAMTVFSSLNSYEKLFVAMSVTSIYVYAKIHVPKNWQEIQVKMAEVVTKCFDKESVFNAGIAVINRKTGKMESKPIPEYSDIHN